MEDGGDFNLVHCGFTSRFGFCTFMISIDWLDLFTPFLACDFIPEKILNYSNQTWLKQWVTFFLLVQNPKSGGG